VRAARGLSPTPPPPVLDDERQGYGQ
jgi:hypothetical protein